MANPYWEVLGAVKSLLEAATAELPAIAGLGTVEVREVPYVLASSDPSPLCLVCPTEGGEQLVKQTFNKGAWWEYPVLVLLISAGNRALGGPAVEARLQARHDVRQRLFVPKLDGLSTHDADCEPRAAADLQAAVGANWVVSGFLMRYRRAEQRRA